MRTVLSISMVPSNTVKYHVQINYLRTPFSWSVRLNVFLTYLKNRTPISHMAVHVNLSVRRRMGKNWLRYAMTISSGTFGVQPGRSAQ